MDATQKQQTQGKIKRLERILNQLPLNGDVSNYLEIRAKIARLKKELKK